MVEPRRPRVLVVDHTEGNRYVAARVLRGEGYDVLEADTGTAALETIRRQAVDLLVLDINLPDMTGYDVVERLRTTAQFATLPVLHLSASFTTSRDRARGLEHGADAYLTHPLEPVVFIATVRTLLRAGEADRRLREGAQEWQATFDALSDAVVLVDEHATVRRANRVACALLGAEVQPVVGRPMRDLLAARYDGQSALLHDRLLEGRPLAKALFRIGDRSYAVTTERVRLDAPAWRTVCVFEDVTERLAVESERRELLAATERARISAEAANDAKSEFLAVMSHELRTPLNAIGGYTQLLEMGIRGPVTDRQREDLGRIRRSQGYLLTLINDVLNFAKIESGHLHVDMDDVLLNALVEGMSDFVEPQLQERRQHYVCESCPEPVKVRGEADKVQQILINLLSNALKFTPMDGTICLGCKVDGDDAVITVRDTGSGIAPEKLESIFEPFVQIDRRYTREQQGVGLGLAISRELARAMGGELSAESVEGEGASFHLRLRRVV